MRPVHIGSGRIFLGVIACFVLLALTWFASFHVGCFQHADQKTFVAFYDLTYLYYRARVDNALSFVISLCDPSPYLYLGLFCVALGLVRRTLRAACAAGIVLVGANLTTLLLKHLLAEPRSVSLVVGASAVPYPRWPSGHTTAAMAFVIALTLVTPARLRPVVTGTGAVFAAAVGCSLLALGSHYPSDVLGGFLVAACWFFPGLVVLRSGEERTVARSTRSRNVAIAAPALALSILVAAGIVLLVCPNEIRSYASTHGLFIVGAVAITAVSAAVSSVALFGLAALGR